MSTEKSDLRRRIDAIPGGNGEDGWWHSSGADTFESLGQQLIDRGFSVDDAVALLDVAYGAVSNEFGG